MEVFETCSIIQFCTFKQELTDIYIYIYTHAQRFFIHNKAQNMFSQGFDT